MDDADDWTLTVECDAQEAGQQAGWQRATLRVDPDALCASLGDAGLQQKLRGDWAPHLEACVKRGGAPPVR